MNKIWEDQIALHSRDEPTFKVLPPVASLPDRVSWSIAPASLKLDHDLQHYIDGDQSPIPEAQDREGYYGDRHFEYWLSGLEMACHTRDIVNKHGGGRKCYVEIGSASGRVIRHFTNHELFEDLWAFDINWHHICWINKHLPKSIKAVQNSSIPVLPLESNSVDCISGMSVFTHIETFELHWLAELRRVLRPGGLVIITVVTDTQIQAMDETWPMFGPITHHPNYSENFVERLSEQGKIVLRWDADRSYSSNVIYSNEYVQNVVSRLFEIVEVRNNFPIYQQCIILRKR